MSANPSAHCQNCGSPLYGEHCYACGQPTKGLVRHFSSIVGDAIDTLFNLDGRFLRTLPALLLKPGFLSREYFDGHRVRYVSPVRLFVVLCIATFFAAKLATPSLSLDGVEVDSGLPEGESAGGVRVQAGEGQDFARATTPAEVEARRATAQAQIEEARRTSGVPGMGLVLDAAKREVDKAADARLAELVDAAPGQPAFARLAGVVAEDDSPPAAAKPADDEAIGDTPTIRFNDRPWDAETNPLVIGWLPQAANDWLNAQVALIPKNWQRIREDPDLLRNAFYSALPTALFVLVPVFALLLKLLYLFKRRLYMEHLVVALHGHAFVCAALLALMGLSALESLLAGLPWLAAPLGWLEWLLVLWMPLYLWLMLKRAYGQGVLMTTLKYGLLGLAQGVLLTIVASWAIVAALVWL